MHQIRFRPELCSGPHWEAYSAPPDPAAGIRGLLLKEGKKKMKKEERGKKRKRRGRRVREKLPPSMLQQIDASACAYRCAVNMHQSFA